MEFIKKNYKYNKDIINDNQKNNNNFFFEINDKFLVKNIKMTFPKKLNSNYFTQKDFFNITIKNIQNEIFPNRKNLMLEYQYQNLSFNKDLNKNIKNKEKKKKYIKNRFHSTRERILIKDNELKEKKLYEEKDIVINYEYAKNKKELINNNIIYIIKKIKKRNLNTSNNNNNNKIPSKDNKEKGIKVRPFEKNFLLNKELIIDNNINNNFNKNNLGNNKISISRKVI